MRIENKPFFPRGSLAKKEVALQSLLYFVAQFLGQYKFLWRAYKATTEVWVILLQALFLLTGFISSSVLFLQQEKEVHQKNPINLKAEREKEQKEEAQKKGSRK